MYGKSVPAMFEDGAHVTGQLLVGTNGSRSSVREILLGAEKALLMRLPFSSTFVQASYSRKQELFLVLFARCILQLIIRTDTSHSLDFRTRQKWTSPKLGILLLHFLEFKFGTTGRREKDVWKSRATSPSEGEIKVILRVLEECF